MAGKTPSMVTPLAQTRKTLDSGIVVHTWSVIEPRAVVILQHGYAEYAERYVDQYSKIIRHFNQRGFEVQAADAWGHGESPGDRGVMHVQKAVLDHIALRQEVAAAYPKLPIFLFGHSIGGLITSASIVASPSHIAGVILTAPALPRPRPVYARRFINSLAAMMPKTSVPPTPARTEDLTSLAEELQVFRDDPLITKRRIPYLIAATALRVAHMVWDGLDRWEPPTLVIHGTADPYTPVAGSTRLVESIKSQDKALRLFEGARHEILNDLDRDVALELILTWMECRVGGKPYSML